MGQESGGADSLSSLLTYAYKLCLCLCTAGTRPFKAVAVVGGGYYIRSASTADGCVSDKAAVCLNLCHLANRRGITFSKYARIDLTSPFIASASLCEMQLDVGIVLPGMVVVPTH
jgi:hypothetical protein